MTKFCKTCGIDKALSEFYSDKNGRNGLSSCCKTCKHKLDKEYYQKNSTLIIDRSRKYEAEIRRDPDRLEKLRKSARDRARLRSKEAWSKHKDRLVLDTEYKLNYQLFARNRRAKRRAKSNGSFTPRDFWSIIEKSRGRCLRCMSFETGLTVDHVIPIKMNGSNNPYNLQPLCMQCNSAKLDKFIDYRQWTMDVDDIGLTA